MQHVLDSGPYHTPNHTMHISKCFLFKVNAGMVMLMYMYTTASLLLPFQFGQQTQPSLSDQL